MYEFENLHPKGKIVGDCVKRAIACAEGREYQEVSKELNRLKKKTGAKCFNEDKNWKTYLKEKGYEKLSFPAVKGKPRMNGERFCDEFPDGSYVLSMAKHLTCCIDGVIYDTWDCSEKCVYNAWKVK